MIWNLEVCKVFFIFKYSFAFLNIIKGKLAMCLQYTCNILASLQHMLDEFDVFVITCSCHFIGIHGLVLESFFLN